MGTWNEKAVGQSGEHGLTTDYAEVHYTGSDFDSYDDAVAALESTAPATLGGRIRDAVRPEDLGGGLFEAVVRYKSDATGGGVGTSVFSFNTAGGTRHITKSRETITRVSADGSTAPDFKGAINVDGDGNVGGADIVWPQYEFNETHYFANDDVDDSFKAIIFSLTGKTNSSLFKGLDEGECLFRGAQGSRRSGGDYEITFYWAGSPNETITFGDGDSSVGVDVKGWELVWYRFENKDDTDANATVRRPTAMYVERVYDPGNFALLGVGT